jgi:hypothetical protein
VPRPRQKENSPSSFHSKGCFTSKIAKDDHPDVESGPRKKSGRNDQSFGNNAQIYPQFIDKNGFKVSVH